MADFEEYTRLYHEAWSDPDIRSLFALCPATMIFDDHDVHDDWNTSESWVERYARDLVVGRARPGAFMAYWIYRHLGNLAPPELAEERLLAEIHADEDGGPALRIRPPRDRRRRRAGGPTTAISAALVWSSSIARRARPHRRAARHGRRRRVGVDCRARRGAV